MKNMRQILKRGNSSLRMADGGGLETPMLQGQAADTQAKLASAQNMRGMAAESDLLKYKVDQAQTASGVPLAPAANPATNPAALRSMQMGMATSLLGSGVRTAMPQIGSQPITMAEGGMFDGIKRAIGMAPPETMIQKYARQDAERAASRPQPVAPAPAQAPAPVMQIQNYGAGSADARMKALGLRDGGSPPINHGMGGHVPGQGEGDKIPAKYEPGEFVVSNDMLDAQPELRGHLSKLREAVLAEKGMTPEQADAKALNGGKGLRAINAGDWTARELMGQGNLPKPTPLGSMADQLTRAVPAPVAAPAAPKYTPPAVNPATGGYVSNERISQGAQGRPAGSAAGSAPIQPQPGSAGVSGGGGSGVSSTLREGLARQTSLVGKGAYAVGRLAPLAGKVAGAAGVVENFNDYKINDPEVDSSASGTYNALKAGDFSGAGRSLGKGALEAGMDLGSFAANTADLFVPGQGPSQAYNKMLRGTFGDRLIDRSGNSAEAPNTPRQPTGLPQASYSNEGRMGFAGPAGSKGVDYGPSLGATDFTEQLNSRPGGKLPSTAGLRDNVIYKTVDPKTGAVTYSGNNVKANGPGGSSTMMDGDGRNMRQIDGNQSGNGTGYVADATTGKRLGSAFADGVNVGTNGFMGQTMQGTGDRGTPSTLRDTGMDVPGALAAAGARGDFDAVRNFYADKGESFGGVTATQFKAQQAAAREEADMPKRGEFGYNRAQVTKTARDANKATLRGQDMDMERAMAPIRFAQEQRRMAGQLLQQTGGDLGAATKLAMRMGVDPTHLQSAWQAETTNKTAEQNLAASKAKGVDDIFANQFSYTDKNGVKQRDQNAEALAKAEVLRASGGKFASMSPDEQAAHAAAAMDNVKLLMSARSKQSTGYLQALGLQADDVALGGMPTADQLQGSTLRDVGLWEGMTTPKIAKGDHRLRLRDGREMTFGRGDLTEAQLKYLTERGAKAGDK